MLRAILIVVWIVCAGAATLPGLGYYLTPLQERPFEAGHALFASSALVGHGYGVVGSAFMLFGVAMYSARRRIGALGKLGKLKNWLQVHIFLCTLGPYLILLHSTFRVGGLVAIAFWSMVLVVASGVFGRYLYVRIPKTIQGTFLSLEAIENRRSRALSALEERGSLDGAVLAKVFLQTVPERPTGPFSALLTGLRWDLSRRNREREIRALLREAEGSAGITDQVVATAMEEARLRVQVALLEPFQRLFRYWHVFHLPLAIVMFLILAVHVTVAAMFGYVWVL
jgi:hypothetical protein